MVRINGQQEDAAGKTLLEYFSEKGYEQTRVAVERNGDIVPKTEYACVLLADGDVLEIVGFVGGG